MSRMDCGVFARPDWHDGAVGRRFSWLMDYLFWIGNDVVSYATDRDLSVHDITEDDAVRPKVESTLTAVDPIFFFHASHGGASTLTGQNMSNLICCPPCSDPNHDILSNRLTYTLSCSSGIQLGPAVIEAKGISFIGYGDFLTICVVEGSDADGAFNDIWAGGAKVLIDGGTAHDAYMWLQRRYRYWIDYWEMNPDPIAPVMLSCLRHDSEALRLFGSRDARIRSLQRQAKLEIEERIDIEP